MLPASLYAPKEVLPLVDTPIINHIVWEAYRAGVTRIHLVLSQSKMEVLNPALKGEIEIMDGIRDDLSRDSLRLGMDGIEIITHIQKKPGGVGDAISCAIGSIDGAFLVLLGDMLILDRHDSPKKGADGSGSNASLEMVRAYSKYGLPCVGVCSVDNEEICNYGVLGISDNMVTNIVEKPNYFDAPSEYVLSGRYIFPENTMEILEMYPESEHGEMQSIRLLEHLMRGIGLMAIKLDQMQMYDSGNPLSWLKSQVDHALRREDMASDLHNWLNSRINGK